MAEDAADAVTAGVPGLRVVRVVVLAGRAAPGAAVRHVAVDHVAAGREAVVPPVRPVGPSDYIRARLWKEIQERSPCPTPSEPLQRNSSQCRVLDNRLSLVVYICSTATVNHRGKLSRSATRSSMGPRQLRCYWVGRCVRLGRARASAR